MRKIKIAQVITRMDWGGSPDIVRILCNGLNPQIYDIRLICGKTLHPSKETKDFLKSFKNNLFYIRYLKRDIDIFKDIIALFNLYSLFRKERFDIVHTHTAKAGFLGRLAARLAGVPIVIYSPHGHNFYGYFGHFFSRIVVLLERFIARFTDIIITLTELEKRDFVVYKIIKPERIVVINSGLELDKYRKAVPFAEDKRDEFKIDKDTAVVGMISRLEPVKGPMYLVEAGKFVIERFPKVKFLIAGEGSLRNKMESRCKEMGVSDKFIFAGWIDNIPRILAILDVLVLPSLNEAVGRVLIEAGACGVPVVAAKVGGVPEIVRNGETGILVPPEDSYKLAQSIILLLEDKDKRQGMAENAKRRVDNKFSAEKMINKVSNLYQELSRSGKI